MSPFLVFPTATFSILIALAADGFRLSRLRTLHRNQGTLEQSGSKTRSTSATLPESTMRTSNASTGREAASAPFEAGDQSPGEVSVPSSRSSAELGLYGQRKAKCMAMRVLDAEFPPLATWDYAVRKVMENEETREYEYLAVQHASIEQLDLQIFLDIRAGQAEATTLQVKGSHQCNLLAPLPPLIQEHKCGRIRLALKNVDKRDTNGKKTRIDWPDAAIDLSIQLDGHVNFIAKDPWANRFLPWGRPAGVRPKLVTKRFDLIVLEAGKGLVHKVVKIAQWIGYLKRLLRQKINEILLDVIRHPIFQLPPDLIQGVKFDIHLKPVTPNSAKRCLDDLCVAFSQHITVVFATGKYAAQEGLDALCLHLAAVTGVDFSPHTNHRAKMKELGALARSTRSMDLKTRWKFGQQPEGYVKPFTTMTASSSGTFEGRNFLEYFRDANKPVASKSTLQFLENFARDHALEDGWYTLPVSGGAAADSKQFALGARGPTMHANGNLRVTQADLDGNPVWAFAFSATGISFAAEQLVLQVVGEGAGEQLQLADDDEVLDLTLDIFRLFGSEAGMELKMDLWLSGALETRTGKVSFCISAPCGGLIEIIKPSSVIVRFTSPILTMEFQNADWTLRLYLLMFVVRANDYMKRAAMLSSLHGSVGMSPGTFDRIEGVKRVRQHRDVFKRLERDYASAAGKSGAERSRKLIFAKAQSAQDAHIFAWRDEEIDAKLGLRIRPADNATLRELCSGNGDSIMELTSDTGDPAEFTLTLADPISSDTKLWVILGTAARETKNGPKLMTLQLKARIRFAISNGELQGCQCPDCLNAVELEGLHVIDKPKVNLLLQGAILFLQGWITKGIGMFLPQLLKPVVSTFLAKHQIKDTEATLGVRIKTELDNDMLEITLSAKSKMIIEPRGMTPNMEAVVPAVKVEAIDGLVGITPKVVAIAARRILNDLKTMIPTGGSVSMSAQAKLESDLSLTYHLSDVKVDAETDAILRNSAILAAQPPVFWKEALADLGFHQPRQAAVASDQPSTTVYLEEPGIELTSDDSSCSFKPRPPNLLHKPREMMALMENVAFDRWVTRGILESTSTLKRSTLEEGHDSQHVLELHHHGDLQIGLHDLMRTFFNDPGLEDFGYIETTFKNLGAPQGSSTNHSVLAVEVACGSVFVEKSFVGEVGDVADVLSMSNHPGVSHISSNSESEQPVRQDATLHRRCVTIRAPAQGDSDICGQAADVSNFISTVKEEASRQRANDALWSSDECRDKLSQFPLTPAFSWKGIRAARRCVSDVDQWRNTGRCVKACGGHAPCQSVRFMLRGPDVVCKYSAFPDVAGDPCEISKDWWVLRNESTVF